VFTQPQTQPTLHTARLALRPFTLDDAADLQRLAGNPEISNTSIWFSLGSEKQWIGEHPAWFKDGAAIHYAVTIDAVLCGYLGLSLSLVHRFGDLGFWIDPQQWNKGYATDACTALLIYGFSAFDLHRITAGHFSRNSASGRVMQKLGMAHEGTLRQHIFKDAHFEDLEIYGLLADEWDEATDRVHQ